MAGLPALQRLKWRIIAVLEVVAFPFVLLVAGSVAVSLQLSAQIAPGFTAGWVCGAIATFLMAPAMTTRTPEGARVRAQMAAYRRTLKMTSVASTSPSRGESSDRSRSWAG